MMLNTENGDIPQLWTLLDVFRKKLGEGADHIPTILMWEHLGSLWFSRVTNLLWQRLEVFLGLEVLQIDMQAAASLWRVIFRPDVDGQMSPIFGLRTCHQILDNLFQKQQQFNRLCLSVFSNNNIQHVYENLLVYIYIHISHELQPALGTLTLEHFLW